MTNHLNKTTNFRSKFLSRQRDRKMFFAQSSTALRPIWGGPHIWNSIVSDEGSV